MKKGKQQFLIAVFFIALAVFIALIFFYEKQEKQETKATYNPNKMDYFDSYLVSNMGYERIKKGKLEFLQDKNGREYRIVYKIGDLNEEIEALYLSRADLTVFPKEE